jgi:hypothetical protein
MAIITAGIARIIENPPMPTDIYAVMQSTPRNPDKSGAEQRLNAIHNAARKTTGAAGNAYHIQSGGALKPATINPTPIKAARHSNRIAINRYR